MAKKTDNHNPKAKLDLRRHFLRKFHADAPPRVLDCCQGSGLLWRTLREEFEVASYWGLDLKPQKGRLKLDSVRVLAQPGWDQNVVDVDTYGSPWGHWEALLPNVRLPATVFLTIGTKNTMERRATRYELAALGCLIDIPIGIEMKLSKITVRYCLAKAWDHAKISEVIEAERGPAACYVGVRLEKKCPAGATTPTGRHTRLKGA